LPKAEYLAKPLPYLSVFLRELPELRTDRTDLFRDPVAGWLSCERSKAGVNRRYFIFESRVAQGIPRRICASTSAFTWKWSLHDAGPS